MEVWYNIGVDAREHRGTFRIAEVARRTGMTTTALRAWERRYRLLSPVRTAGGHRLYSLSDVARVERVQQLVAEGWTVAAAAERVVGEGDEEDHPRLEQGPPALPPGRPEAGTEARRRVLDALAAADPFVVLAAYETTRALVRAADVAAVSAALREFVRRVGGELGPADLQGEAVLPVDLAFGVGEPVLPRADPGSLARMRLEAVLPLLVEDARSVAYRLLLARERDLRGAATR